MAGVRGIHVAAKQRGGIFEAIDGTYDTGRGCRRRHRYFACLGAGKLPALFCEWVVTPPCGSNPEEHGNLSLR